MLTIIIDKNLTIYFIYLIIYLFGHYYILEIFSDSVVDKFTADVNNFCTVIYIINILAFSTDIKT